MSGDIRMNANPCYDKNRQYAGESDGFMCARGSGSVHDGGRNPAGIRRCDGTQAGTLCGAKVV
jgi:hypothetical protein